MPKIPIVFWKVYFYIWLTLLASTIYSEIIENSLSRGSNLLNLFFLTLGAIAMFGVAYQKRVASRALWRFFFLVQAGLLTLGVIAILLSPSKSTGPFDYNIVNDIILSALMFVPYFYGLYQYCYKSESLWVPVGNIGKK
jgi:ABC-type transport system involved in cytochrome c biogenesis permease subunit